MSEPNSVPATITVTSEILDSWANDPNGPVALHVRQKMLPVEVGDGPSPVIFPPTYAVSERRTASAMASSARIHSPYAIDELSDGTKVVQVDSVGAQANRMEPLFKRAKPGQPDNPLAKLVPQVDIFVTDSRTNQRKAISLLDASHRLGDALIRVAALNAAAAGEDSEVSKAFAELEAGDATRIAKLAPTSLVFGAWDSRGEGAKLPRIVQSVIRAWDIDPLRRSAQYNPSIDFNTLGVLDEREKAEAEDAARSGRKNPAAQMGYVHVPAVDTHGGVVVRGGIYRDVTVNLIALRQLDGEDGAKLRCYVLGLALLAAKEQQDGFLRQGCLLTLDPDAPAQWKLVNRTGERKSLAFGPTQITLYAKNAAEQFGVGQDCEFVFSTKLAREDLDKAKKEQGRSSRRGGEAST
jgi:CRISPR-associated protein Csb1